MPDPQPERVESRNQSNRDGSITASIGILGVLLIAGLWVISRHADSAVQQDSVALTTAAVSGEAGCTNFGEFWTTGSGVNVPVEAIEHLTNCRQAADGSWFVPSGADDGRLQSRSIPDANQMSLTSDLREQLLDDLNALVNQLPDSLVESLSANYDEVNQPVFGHTKRGRTDLTVKRNRYTRITQAFLIDPNRIVLADYVGWVTERRTRAIDSFETACRADPDLGFVLRACMGMRNEFGVAAIPLYWDLMDPVLLNEYLILRASEPLAIPEPTVESTT